MLSLHLITSVIIYFLAGICLFLVSLNRFSILLKDGWFKTVLIVFSFLLLISGSLLAGVWLPYKPWIIIPQIALGLIILGEIRRIIIRKSIISYSPEDSSSGSINVCKPITTTDIEVKRYQISLPNWFGRPFRIVHLSDLHVHSTLPSEYFENVLNIAELTKADFAFFTGDFITNLSYLSKLKKILRPIGKQGTFAVLGNHDYWADSEAVGTVVKDCGLTLLINESIETEIDGHKITISGYDYPWGTKKEIPPMPPNNILHLVLSHTPDNIYKLAKSKTDVVFSGHNHGGQIRIPYLGALVVPSIFGRRFDLGHFVVNRLHLFVSSGVGTAIPSWRIYCRPDIMVIDISGEHQES